MNWVSYKKMAMCQSGSRVKNYFDLKDTLKRSMEPAWMHTHPAVHWRRTVEAERFIAKRLPVKVAGQKTFQQDEGTPQPDLKNSIKKS